MVKGKQKEYNDSDEIYLKTNGGFDIFKYYLGNVGRIMNRPWGKKETKMSWGIFPFDGKWHFKDQASEEKGSAVQFVQKYFNLSYKEAIDKIAWDFGFSQRIVNANPAQITWEKPDIEKDYTDIGVKTKPFGTKEHKFWNAAEVPEEHCKKYNCFSIKSLAINKKFFPIKKDEMVFGYYCEEESGWKIYFPERRESKFRNNVSGKYIWYLEKQNNCQNLLIAKSNKDAIVLSNLGLCVAATQNEGISCIQPNVDIINSKAKNIYIVYGNDKQGWDMSYRITKEYGWKYFNIPQPELSKGILDPYDYAKAYGLKKLEELLKNKNLL